MSVDRDPAQLHVPVLLNECLDMLAPAIDAPGAVLIDATLGMGGHTEAALTRFPQLTVFGIDRDPSAIALASKRLEAFGPRFRAFHTTYDKMDEVAAHAPSGMVDGILMDLGVSSLQLCSTALGLGLERGNYADSSRLRGRKVRLEDRWTYRRHPRERASDAHFPASSNRSRLYSRTGTPYVREPRKAHLPSATYCGQRRTDHSRGRASCRSCAPARWRSNCHRVIPVP